MSDRKPLLKNADMSEEMQQDGNQSKQGRPVCERREGVKVSGATHGEGTAPPSRLGWGGVAVIP
jgi:hypothetical protein